MNVARSIAVTGALAILAGSVAAQRPSDIGEANRMKLYDGATNTVFVFSDPSVGSSTGTFPPDYNSDLFCKVYPAKSLLDDSGVLFFNGFDEFIFDTDWAATDLAGNNSVFYDRLVGGACDNPLFPGNETADFACGTATGTLYVLGGISLPDPCTTSPPLCNSGVCPPTGYVVGYRIQSTFTTSGVAIPADGLTSTATTYFLPGGMVFTSSGGGQCGLGDYVLSDAHSTDERMHDADPATGLPLGYAINDGFQVAFSGLTAGGVTDAAGASLIFGNNPTIDPGTGMTDVEPILTTRVSDPITGYIGNAGTVALQASAASGTMSIGVQLNSLENSSAGASGATGDLVIAAASVTGTLPAGLKVIGGDLMLIPDPVFNVTASQWIGTMSAVGTGIMEGQFDSLTLPVNNLTSKITLDLQAFVIDTSSGLAARESQVFQMDIYP